MYIFDLDETILSINSHYHFSELFFKKQGTLVYRIYRVLTQGLIGKAIGHLTKSDARRTISFVLFRLFPKQELKNAASALYQKSSTEHFNQEILKFFFELRDKHKNRVQIVTATPDFIAQAFQPILDVEIHSSIYNRGKLEVDLLSAKPEYIMKTFGEIELIVSDSFEDLRVKCRSKIFVNSGTMYCSNFNKEDFVLCGN